MKKLLILTVLLLNMMPWLENGSITFTTPYRLTAQSMGSESPFTAGNCTILCGAGSISGPCATINSIPCNFTTVTPATNPPPTDPTPTPTYTPPPSDPCSPNTPGYNPCNCGQVCGGASGGGSSSNSSNSTTTTTVTSGVSKPKTPPNPTKKAPTADCEQLASIISDLVGKLRNSTALSQSSTPSTRPLSSYFDEIKGRAAGGDPMEHGFPIYQNDPISTLSSSYTQYGVNLPANPNLSFGPMQDGTKSNINISIMDGFYSNTFHTYRGPIAIVHSHPNSGYTAPSATDFYTLGTYNLSNNNNNQGMVDSYIIGAVEEFNMHIIDRNQLTAFLAAYPASTNLDVATATFKGPLGLQYQKAYNNFISQGYSDNDANTYAVAAVINNSGIRTLRNTGNGYKQLNASLNAGPVVTTITECK